MENYKELDIEVIFFENIDVITDSVDGNVDTDPIHGKKN